MIEKDIDLVFKGPCEIEVKQGKIDIAGIEVTDKIRISQPITFTITTLAESDIQTNCQIITKYPTLSWRQISENISGKIIVIGNENNGKSYLSNMISNLHNIPLLDADVGQSSIFIPTFISLSAIKKSLVAREKGYTEIEFFGDITPSVNPVLHIALLTKLANSHSDVVIDTDGWISGFLAYRHKLELIYKIDPDYIIVFQDEFYVSLPKELNKKTIIMKKFSLGDWRTQQERRKYRQVLYKNYFNNSNEIKLDVDKLFGTPVTENLFINWRDMVQIGDEEPCEGYYISDIKGLLVGLTLNGKIVGAGIISAIDKDYVTIKTPVPKADGILLSHLSLNDLFEEKRIKIGRCTS